MDNPHLKFFFEEKRSKFYCYAYHVSSRDEIKKVSEELKKEHKKARHILKACRYEMSENVYTVESSENQEPISSMKKLVSVMEKREVKNIAIFIVRYFGGTKLGASRLERLYFDLGIKTLDLIDQEVIHVEQ